MNWDSFTTRQVRIEYADTATMNRIRAWARKNGATVQVSQYTRGAYEGHVSIPSPWNEGNSVAEAKATALKALIGARKA